MESDTSSRKFSLKKGALIGGGVILFIAIAAVITVVVLQRITPVESSQSDDTTAGIDREQAKTTKQQAIDSLSAGENDKALELFQKAREQYLAADKASGEFTEEAPSPDVVDIDAQIKLIESTKDAPQPQDPGIESSGR